VTYICEGSNVKLTGVGSIEYNNSICAKEDLVSVIIPAYNHQEYIEFCLNSILQNTYKDIEIIIIDDGSNDSTFQIAVNWSSIHHQNFHRIYIETQTNVGLSNTLNKLISLSKGDYITLLASDDALTRDSIDKRIKFLRSSVGKKVVIGNCYLMDQNNNISSSDGIRELHKGSPLALSDHRKLPGEMILRWSIPGPVMLAHRSVYDDDVSCQKYNPNLIVEDRYWYLNALSNNYITFINTPVAYYRIHNTNSTKDLSNRSKIMKDIYKSETKMLERFHGMNKFMLYISSKKNLREIKYLEKPILKNKMLLVIIDNVTKAVIYLNRIIR